MVFWVICKLANENHWGLRNQHRIKFLRLKVINMNWRFFFFFYLLFLLLFFENWCRSWVEWINTVRWGRTETRKRKREERGGGGEKQNSWSIISLFSIYKITFIWSSERSSKTARVQLTHLCYPDFVSIRKWELKPL